MKIYLTLIKPYLIFLLFILIPIILMGQEKVKYNPKEKHENGYKIAKIKYRPPNKIDRRITNKSIYYNWSDSREAVERSKHPEGGYLTVKLNLYNDLITPTQRYEVWVMDPNYNLIEKHDVQPGFRPYRPSRYIWEYFRKNQKIIVPLRTKTPDNVKRIVIINTTTRTVQEFLIICTRGEKSNL